MKHRWIQSVSMLIAVLVINFFSTLWLQGASIPAAWASALGQAAPSQGAAIPATFNYQGYVRNADGTLVTGPHTIVAKLWEEAAKKDGEKLLHEELFANVPVRDGLFNVVLGDAKPFPADLFLNHAPLYLGITLDGGTELAPRQRIHAVPWALMASTLTQNATVNGLTNNGPTVLNGAITSAVTMNGPVTMTQGVTVKAIQHTDAAADDAPDPGSYDMSLQRYTVEATDGGAQFNSVDVDDAILKQLCADEDGCTLNIAMRDWDIPVYKDAGLLAMVGPIRFSLANKEYDGKRFWRSDGDDSNGIRFSNIGTDGIGNAESVVTAWDCNFHDGIFEKGQAKGDSKTGFSLMNMNTAFTDPAMTCVLTIDD